MASRKSSRRIKPPLKLKDFDIDGLIAESTPQQVSEAVERELSQVESMIKDLSPTKFKAEQEQERAVEDLRNQNLKLELHLTRTKLELLKLQQDSAQPSAPKMATTITTTPNDNPIAKPTLKSLQQDPTFSRSLNLLWTLWEIQFYWV